MAATSVAPCRFPPEAEPGEEEEVPVPREPHVEGALLRERGADERARLQGAGLVPADAYLLLRSEGACRRYSGARSTFPIRSDPRKRRAPRARGSGRALSRQREIRNACSADRSRVRIHSWTRTSLKGRRRWARIPARRQERPAVRARESRRRRLRPPECRERDVSGQRRGRAWRALGRCPFPARASERPRARKASAK